MPDIKPFIISGMALGSVYALSGVGLVVLYRATATINLAYGATGATGAMVAWEMIDRGQPEAAAWLVAILVATALSMAYGVLVVPQLSRADSTTRTIGTLGFALILLGLVLWQWPDVPRSLTLPTDDYGFTIAGVRVVYTKVLALALAIAITFGVTTFLQKTRVGLSMRAMADDRQVAGVLGVNVTATGLYAWTLNGVLAGVSGLLLATLIRLDIGTLMFMVIPGLAAAVIGKLRSLHMTLIGGVVLGTIESVGAPFESVSSYRGTAPFIAAIVYLLVASRTDSQRAAAGP